MRPIDADALYETLCHIWDRSDSEEFEQDVFESIANAPTIDQPRGEWIPCSERLPLHGSRVLVTATHKKLGHTAVDVLRYHGDEYGWEGSDFCIVNAWMPLPAPYGGESNG